jgi:hypothetical protein
LGTRAAYSVAPAVVLTAAALLASGRRRAGAPFLVAPGADTARSRTPRVRFTGEGGRASSAAGSSVSTALTAGTRTPATSRGTAAVALALPSVPPRPVVATAVLFSPAHHTRAVISVLDGPSIVSF